MTHLTEATVIDRVFDGTTESPEEREHRLQCLECSEMWAEIELMTDDLSDPEVWDIAPAAPPSAEGLNKLLDLEERLAFERAEARRMLQTGVLNLQKAGSIEATVGMIDILSEHIDWLTERDPLHAEFIAEIAVDLSRKLPDEQYPRGVVSQSRGIALKWLANAARKIGHFDKALRALDQAAEWFSASPVPDSDLASVDYVRATVFLTQGKLIEARRLLHRSIETFAAFGEDSRRRNAQLLLSGIEHRSGNVELAVQLIEPLLAESGEYDSTFRGRVLHNLGVYLIDLDPNRASSCLRQAQHCLETAGLQTEAFRSLWQRGTLARKSGDHERAESILTLSYEKALDLGLQIDVALITLEMAEIALETCELSRVAELASTALADLRALDAPLYAAQAFEYLQRAAGEQTLGIPELKFVRGFFEAAGSTNSFTPPS